MSQPIQPSQPIRRLGGLRFGLRTLFAAICLVAVLLAWWRDRRNLMLQMELQELRLKHWEEERKAAGEILSRGAGFGFYGASRDFQLEREFPELEDYVKFVRTSPKSAEVEQTFSLLKWTGWKQDVIPAFLELLKSPTDEVRRRACVGLGEISWDAERFLPELVPLLDDSNADVQRAAVTALQRHSPAVPSALPALRRHARSLTSRIAVEAALAAGVLSPEFKIDVHLLNLLHHRDPSVRARAVEVIPKHVAPQLAEEALRGLFVQESNTEVKSAVADAINELRVVRGMGAAS
jgi:hypothetical protein